MATKREPPISWRPPKALRDRIEALAKDRRVALSSVLEDLVQRGLLVTDGTSLSVSRRDDGPVVAKPGKARKGLCEHRRTPEEFCARCDAA